MRSPTRHIQIATVAALVATAAACSSSGTPGSSAAGTSSAAAGTATKLSSMQFVDPLPNFPAFKAISACMGAEAKAHGISYTESGPTGNAVDTSAMIQEIQQATAAKEGAIVTIPESAGFTPVLSQAQKAGLVTETMYGTGGAGSGADVNISVDWSALGKLYVDAIAKSPGQQNVGLVTPSDTGFGKQFIDGVTAAAAATPNVKIVGQAYIADDASEALPETTALLAAHPEINVIASNTGVATPGISAVIKSQNKVGRVFLVGQGYGNGGTQALQDGTASYLLLQGYCKMGKDAVDGLIAAAAGKKNQQLLVSTVMATKANLQSYISRQYG